MNEVVNVSLNDIYSIVITLNWLFLLVIIVTTYLTYNLLKKCIRKKVVQIEEVNLGIGSNTIKLTCNKKDKEIAYKLWVELSTRKIGMPYDKNNDVIVEIYNSWYAFFKTARELLKEIPINKINSSNELIDLTDKMLNHGLRPHLTVWQAKFRKWFKNNNDVNITPQLIQITYPEYDELLTDLIETNKKMIYYTNLMRQIAFDD